MRRATTDRRTASATATTAAITAPAAPPPCDSSLLIQNAGLLSAEAEFTVNGVLFSEIVLLPAVQ